MNEVVYKGGKIIFRNGFDIITRGIEVSRL